MKPKTVKARFSTTLRRIREHSPCHDGWVKLLKHIGKTHADDEPLPLLTVLESNGIADALWCLRAVDGIDKIARLFACDCAARALQRAAEQDERSHKAVEVARSFARGKATATQLFAARDAAWDAARDAARDAEREWQSARLRLYLTSARLPKPIPLPPLRKAVKRKAAAKGRK